MQSTQNAKSYLDVIGEIGEVYKNAQALWMAIGLPDSEQEQRRVSFLEQMSEFGHEFIGAQEQYYKYVEQQVQQLIGRAKQLQELLGLKLELPAPQGGERLFVILQRLERTLKTLEGEFDARREQVESALKEIQRISEECGLPLPSEVEGIFQVPMVEIAMLIQERAATVDQISRLQKIAKDHESKAQPLYSEAKAVAAELRRVLQDLGWCGPDGGLFPGCGVCQHSPEELAVIQRWLSGAAFPREAPVATEALTALRKEVEQRVALRRALISEIKDLRIAIEGLSTPQEDGEFQFQPQPCPESQALASLRASLLGSILGDQRIRALEEAGVSDAECLALEEARNALQRAYETEGRQIACALLCRKYRALAELNPRYAALGRVNVADALRRLPPGFPGNASEKIVQLCADLGVLSQASEALKPLHDAAQAVENLHKDARELQDIQADKTRFTSKSREALAQRKREDVLRKELLTAQPKALARLVAAAQRARSAFQLSGLNLNDVDLLYSGREGPPDVILPEEIFGRDYAAEAHKEAAAMDHKARARFEQYLALFRSNINTGDTLTDSYSLIRTGTKSVVIKTPAPPTSHMRSPRKNISISASGSRRIVRGPETIKASTVEATPGGGRTRLQVFK